MTQYEKFRLKLEVLRLRMAILEDRQEISPITSEEVLTELKLIELDLREIENQI